MKKKFFQILVLLAVSLTMGVFVTSCKDTNEDLYNELKLQMISGNASLADALKTQIANLQKQIDDLKKQLDAIKSCECDPTASQALIDGLQTQIDQLKAGKADKAQIEALQKALDDFKTAADATYATKAMLTSEVARLEGLIEAAKCKCDDSEILRRLGEVEAAVVTAQSTADAAKAAAATAQTAADAAKSAADVAKAAADAAQATADGAQAAADAAKSAADAAKALADANKALIDINIQDISEIKTNLVTINTNLAQALADAQYAKNWIDINKVVLEGLNERVTKNEGDIEQNKKDIEQNKKDIEALTKDLEDAKTELETKITDLKTVLEKEISDLEEKVDANTTKISEVEQAYKDADKALQDEIDDIIEDIEDLTEQVEQNTKDIAELAGLLDEVIERLSSLVTSINVHVCESPAFGYFNLPANVSSNLLMAYYSYATDKVYFPTSRTGHYVSSVALTSDELQLIGMSASDNTPLFFSGDLMMSQDKGNAGQVYMTVNPDTVDFTKLKVSLENSQGVESGVKLGSLQKTNTVLQSGYTRAANNGFYVAQATVENPNAVQKINLDTESIKDDIKDIIKNRQNANFTSIASDLANMIQSMNLDANAVRCQAPDGKASVYSTYNIAATAVNPINFVTMQNAQELIDGKVSSLETRANSFLTRITDKVENMINSTISDVQKKADIKIQYIAIENFDNATGTITLDVTFKDNNGYTADAKPAVVTMSLAEVVGYLANASDDIDKQFVDFLQSVNDLVKTAQDMYGNGVGKVQNLLQKAFNLVHKGTGHIADMVEPTMILANNAGSKIMLASKSQASVVDAGLTTFVPTSWTYEYIVPICKKHVAVVDAYKSDGVTDKTEVAAANGGSNMNQVLSGQVREVKTNLKSGYTYVIAYSALDYAGNIICKKYYVKVK